MDDVKVGDKVRFIDPDGSGCRGTKTGAIYTVESVSRDYFSIVELGGQCIYRRRFELIPRGNKDIIKTALTILQDTTNSRGELDLATRAIEELEKL